ncbi:MAG TPA: DNA polymerase III subunit beta [Blastocatellia bacterium]|nr:DNA polymerase III subunit beta [Blastocatellia bacterium]
MTSPLLIKTEGPQIRIAKAPLVKELALLQTLIERKNTIPILSTILIQGRGAEISIVGTDLDVSLQTVCPAEVTGEFSAVVQARKFFDIVRSLPESDILLSMGENNWVTITCGASEFNLHGQNKDTFPAVPTVKDFDFIISASALNGLINRTAFAITQEESRYALNGSLFRVVDSQPLMVATDGHRLALARANTQVVICQSAAAWVSELSVVIPKKALTELAKLTAGHDGGVNISKDDNHLYFKIGARLLTSRMLSGQFPNYDLVIPKTNDTVVSVNRDLLTQAIRRAGIMADERSHGVKIEFASGRLELSAQSAEVGAAREGLNIDYKGAGLTIGFNFLYMIDFLNVISGDMVKIALKDDQSPALFTPESDDSFVAQFVLMPMRLI